MCVQDQFSNISRKDKFSSFVLKRDFLSSFHNAFAFAFAFDLRSDLFVSDQFFRSFRSLQADRFFIASIFYMCTVLFDENVYALAIIRSDSFNRQIALGDVELPMLAQA